MTEAKEEHGSTKLQKWEKMEVEPQGQHWTPGDWARILRQTRMMCVVCGHSGAQACIAAEVEEPHWVLSQWESFLNEKESHGKWCDIGDNLAFQVDEVVEAIRNDAKKRPLVCQCSLGP